MELLAAGQNEILFPAVGSEMATAKIQPVKD